MKNVAMIIDTNQYSSEQLPKSGEELWSAADSISKEVKDSWKKGKLYKFNKGIEVQTYSTTKKGEQWLCRISKHKLSKPQYSKVLYTLLGVEEGPEGKWIMPDRSRRSIIEAQYIDVLKRVNVEEEVNGWVRINSQYELSGPLAARDFNQWVYPMEPSKDANGVESSLVISLRANTDTKPENKAKGHVPAWYVSVERLEYNYTTSEFTWLNCSASDAGGNIPKWLQSATIAKTVAQDVPNLFDYLGMN